MDNNRLRWACRRGMLELDLIFESYLDHAYAKASAEEQAQFEALLDCNDQSLFDWLVKREPCDSQHQTIVEILRVRRAVSRAQARFPRRRRLSRRAVEPAVRRWRGGHDSHVVGRNLISARVGASTLDGWRPETISGP